MPRDEDLIAHGWPEDVWFHVDNLSSAHVYLRMRDGEKWDAIPQELLTDCAQLTKANSIEGNKKDNITVIYTPWSNLKKSGDMATGQVGFKDQKMVKKIHVPKRENPIVNRLNKTKVEKFPDLRQEKADRERELRKVERIAAQEKVSIRQLDGWCLEMLEIDALDRREQMPKWPKNVRRSSTRKNICMMICTPKITWRKPAMRTGIRTSWTISSDLLLERREHIDMRNVVLLSQV